jgi:hypothetical protein
MPKLGLTTSLGSSGLTTPGIVTDNLVMKHMYPAGAVQPLSDGAAFFDGTDDYIDLGSISTGSSGANLSAITVSAWVFRKDGNENVILTFGDTDWKFAAGTTLQFGADISGTSSGTAISTGLNQWVHLATTVTGTTAKVYENGALIDTDTVTTFDNSSGSIASYIGRQSSEYFSGYICNVAIWSRVLDIDEIKAIMWKQYADLTTSESTSLISWWNLDTNANDSTGTNNGTLS